MKQVLIVFGGVSSEYEVSLRSARAVIDHVDASRWVVHTLGITKDGRWLWYTGTSDKIEDGSWCTDAPHLTPAVISPDRSVHGAVILSADGVRTQPVDVVFPVLHGKNGEDGTIQGYLQLSGIPFVGCDALSSAISMDKALTNTMADHIGVPQAKWLGVTASEYARNAEAFRAKCTAYLGYPLFVKPANAGSSVGVTKVSREANLDEAMRRAFLHDRKVVLEEGIDGIEVECAVLGNDELYAPMVGEIVPCNDFYDYEAKYIAAESELHIPARIPQDTFDEVRKQACRIFRALGCSGLSRCDFFVRRSDGQVLFNEINTIPGFTSISMYAKMLMAAGMEFGEIVDSLLTLALEKWSET